MGHDLCAKQSAADAERGLGSGKMLRQLRTLRDRRYATPRPINMSSVFTQPAGLGHVPCCWSGWCCNSRQIIPNDITLAFNRIRCETAAVHACPHFD